MSQQSEGVAVATMSFVNPSVAGQLPLAAPATPSAAWRDEPPRLAGLADVVVGHGPLTATSGNWWSIPLAFDQDAIRSVSSARTLPTGQPALLELVEDSSGDEQAWLRPLTRDSSVDAPSEIFEIATAADWARLCTRFPREVTHSRGPDWERVTGRTGRWLMPDWPAVADVYAGVHLTVAGYLAAATTSISTPLPDGEFASMIAGWNPDETFWFTDVRLGDPVRWVEVDGTWARAD